MSELRIAVGVAPYTKDIGTELGLVKAALLYADKVKLYSPTSAMLLSVGSFTDLPTECKLETIVHLASAIKGPEEAAQLAEVVRLYRLSNRKTRRKFEPKLTSTWKQYAQAFGELLDKFNAREIHQAIKDGVIEPYQFDFGSSSALEDSLRVSLGENSRTQDIDQLVAQFVGGVLEAISDPLTYPLLDKSVGDLISSGIKAGAFKVSNITATKGAHVALASELFHRLPVLEKASIDELLDIRRELQTPLIRFRGGLIELSRKVQSASWAEDFAAEAELIIRGSIEPAIVELEERIQENSYLRHLLNKVVGDSRALVAALGLAVTSQLDLLDSLVGNTAVGGILLSQAWQAEQVRKAERKAVENHQLYFYCRLRQYPGS